MRLGTTMFLLALAPAALHAQEKTYTLAHQGRLLNSDDQPVTTATEITVSLYDQKEGGSAKWSQNYTVAPANGLYSLELGDTTGGKKALVAADLAGDRWVALTIGGTELSPRQRIHQAPSAIFADKAQLAERATLADRASVADTAITADQLGGVGASDYALKTYVDGKIAQVTPTGYARLDGAVFTGSVQLAADPSAPLQAATKGYVDAGLAGVYTKAQADQKYLTIAQAGAADGYATKAAMQSLSDSLAAYAKKSDLGGAGANLVSNGDLQAGAEGFTLTNASAFVVSDGMFGTTAFQNVATAIGTVDGTRKVLLDRSKVYHGEAWVRRTSTTSAGKVSFAVRLFDQNGNEIKTGAEPWWIAVRDLDVDTNWRRVWVNFGGSSRALPGSARFATLTAILNSDNGGAGNRTFQVQGFQLTQHEEAPWIRVSREDFESGTPTGWTGLAANVTICSDGSNGSNRILGGYNTWAAGDVNKTFDLTNVPHTEAMLRASYYAIDTWDGIRGGVSVPPESGIADLNGIRFWEEAMDGQLGGTNLCGISSSGDRVRQLETKMPHAGNSLPVHFGSTVNQTANDESWGIDNVEIWVR